MLNLAQCWFYNQERPNAQALPKQEVMNSCFVVSFHGNPLENSLKTTSECVKVKVKVKVKVD